MTVAGDKLFAHGGYGGRNCPINGVNCGTIKHVPTSSIHRYVTTRYISYYVAENSIVLFKLYRNRISKINYGCTAF